MFYRFARVVDEETLEDIYFRCWDHLTRYEERPIQPGLIGIVFYRAICEFIRKRTSSLDMLNHTSDVPLTNIMSDNDTIDEHVSNWEYREVTDNQQIDTVALEEQCQLVQRALKHIPIRLAVIGALYYVADCTDKEISERCSVSVRRICELRHSFIKRFEQAYWREIN
jgi:DNA-directed RNA polymerase specialized sigma24 family protein